VKQVSGQVTGVVRTMAVEDYHLLRSKRKAIAALLPFTVWEERGGQPEMLNTFLYAARAWKEQKYLWGRTEQFASPLFFKASDHAILLASPYIPWKLLRHRGDLVRQWAKATSTVPYTEEIGQSVVDTLLQIISEVHQLPPIPFEVWSWLTRLPPLPPVCLGRCNGTYPHAIKAVRELGDIGLLKSYLLLVWAEWDFIFSRGFDEMCDLIREDFSGIWMGYHRKDLIRRLDYMSGWIWG